ncbi:MAG: hypothetical protein O2798_10550 [Chloroflexi bacterium]|nr:hypothetical protein [Chloroflexota bacterium]
MVDPFRVAILQLTAGALAGYEAAFAEALQRIDDAARDEPDLIVLPEAIVPGSYLGDTEAVARTSWYADSEILRAIGDRARRAGCYVAAGVVLRDSSSRLLNSAVLFAPDGVEIARASEATPAPWFTPGEGPVMANPRAIPAALVAGADLLDPRWTASIASVGTQMIISTGAPRGWVRGARSESPADYLLPARGAEAGAWIVSAGRTGTEPPVTHFTGGAGIVTPSGAWAVRAPASQTGIVLHDIDLDAARPSAIEPPEVAPGVSGHAEEAAGPIIVAAVALDPVPSTVELMESVRALVGAAAAAGAGIVVLPDLAGGDPRAVSKTETLPLIEALSAQSGVAVVVVLTERVDGVTYKTAFAVEAGRTVVAHRACVLNERETAAGFTPGETLPPVVTLHGCRVGLLAGSEGNTATVAASLRARGATLLTWCGGHHDGPGEATARARAWEQRLPVIAAGGTGTSSAAYVVAAGGHLEGATAAGSAGVALASVDAGTIGAGG